MPNNTSVHYMQVDVPMNEVMSFDCNIFTLHIVFSTKQCSTCVWLMCRMHAHVCKQKEMLFNSQK